MAIWHSRQLARAPTVRRGGGRALIAVVVLAAVLGAYVYQHWPSEPLAGTAWVADGDSLEIGGVRLRLEGIDAPELNQTCTDAKGQSWPCGRAAQRELRAHLGRRALKCESNGADQFGRVLAVCFLPDGASVNAWMVRQGWAVTSGYARTYRSEQDEAKAARRGLWAGTFVPPAEWRRGNPRE